jgi:hypothetical protein
VQQGAKANQQLAQRPSVPTSSTIRLEALAFSLGWRFSQPPLVGLPQVPASLRLIAMNRSLDSSMRHNAETKTQKGIK